MASLNDMPSGLFGPNGVNAHFGRGLRNNSNVTLTRDEFNAAKHTSTSSIMSDIFGPFAAGVLGGGIEVLQDLSEGFRQTGKVSDDHKDITNNFIGRAVQQAFPGQSAADYQRAAAELANAGLLETNVNAHYDSARALYEVAQKMAKAAIKHLEDAKFSNGANGPDCFLAGTSVAMWNGERKPIEEIAPDDWVASYDASGKLKPGRVVRTFQNQSKHILDMHGLMMTPGHVTYCANVKGEDNRFADSHVPVMDILRSDGALMKKDGSLIRTSTGEPVGSLADRKIWAVAGNKQGGQISISEKDKIRLGTRFIMPNGEVHSVLDMIANMGAMLNQQGMLVNGIDDEQGYVFHWEHSAMLPKPEDYVLQRSQLTIEEIYQADEWTEMRPQMPAPLKGEAGHSFKQDLTFYANVSNTIQPNMPLSMHSANDESKTGVKISRKQRRAIEAKQRKAEKQSRTTVH